jgi:predicted porin
MRVVRRRQWISSRSGNRTRRTIAGSLGALGVLLGTGWQGAHAQSSVTLYGLIDAGLVYKTNAGVADGKSASAISLSGNNHATSRWGLLGFEDIGGGTKITFRLESGFNPSNGAGNFGLPFPSVTNSLFDRGAIVGVVAPWGALKAGRNWTPLYDAYSAADITGFSLTGSLANAVFQNSSNVNPALPAAAAATGANSAVNGGFLYQWLNNSVKYELPTNRFGLSGSALYSFGGTAGQFQNKQAWSANLNWTGSQLGLIAGYYDARDPTGATNENWLRAYTLAVKYTLGTVKTAFDFIKFRNPTTGANQNYYFTAVAWQITPSLRVTGNWMYLQDLKQSSAGANLYRLGGEYFLSKRTSLYTDVAFVDNKPRGTLGAGVNSSPVSSNAATIGRNQTAITVGMRTTF